MYTENEDSNALSRRGFIGLGAVAAIGGAAIMTGCTPKEAVMEEEEVLATKAWYGIEPEIAENDITSSIDTDFLIIGAGTAGPCAAGAAQDLGMDFVICDKAAHVPETREYLGAVDTKFTKEAGVIIDKGKLLNELTRYASGKCDQDLIKLWIDESAEMVDWVDQIMSGTEKVPELDMPPMNPSGGTDYYIPYTQHMWEPAYMPPMRNDVIAGYLNAAGNDIKFNHEMVRLVHNDGKVSGAIFNTDNGYVQINAKDTLLATGGYAANPDMMKELQPAAVGCITAASYNPNCDGSGIKAGLWAGGIKDPDPTPMVFDRGAVLPGVDAGYDGEGENAMLRGSIFQENIGSQPFMKVARSGKRFTNESTPYDFLCFAAGNQPGGVWCQVHDANVVEDMKRFETVGCSRIAPWIGEMLSFEEYTEASASTGCLMSADTIEELAEKLGFDGKSKEEFLAQVERYNTYYDKQLDEEYGKEAYRLSELRTPPFYGCWFGGSLLTTLDGLKINKDCQALNADGNIIEGLYAVGDVSGNFFSGNYPEYIVGVASGRSSVQGRHVAKLLAGASA